MPSLAGFDLGERAEHFAENKIGIDVAIPMECDTTTDHDGGIVRRIEASDGEIVTAVDNLMADLGQLDAEMPNAVRTFIPNGSVYLPRPVTRFSLAKRTSDNDAVVTGSCDATSLTDAGTLEPSRLDSSLLLHNLQSSPFNNRASFATSDHESDLDTAIKSILS